MTALISGSWSNPAHRSTKRQTKEWLILAASSQALPQGQGGRAYTILTTVGLAKFGVSQTVWGNKLPRVCTLSFYSFIDFFIELPPHVPLCLAPRQRAASDARSSQFHEQSTEGARHECSDSEQPLPPASHFRGSGGFQGSLGFLSLQPLSFPAPSPGLCQLKRLE